MQSLSAAPCDSNTTTAKHPRLPVPAVVRVEFANVPCCRIDFTPARPYPATCGIHTPLKPVGIFRGGIRQPSGAEFPIAGTETRTRLSLANPLSIVRGDPVAPIDAFPIGLVDPKTHDPAGLGARLTKAVHRTAIRQLGLPQEHDIAVVQTATLLGMYAVH